MLQTKSLALLYANVSKSEQITLQKKAKKLKQSFVKTL
jgi:hypothetical protein